MVARGIVDEQAKSVILSSIDALTYELSIRGVYWEKMKKAVVEGAWFDEYE